MRTATILLIVATLILFAGCNRQTPAPPPTLTVRIVTVDAPRETWLPFNRGRSRCSGGSCAKPQASQVSQPAKPVTAAVERSLQATVMINNRGMGGGSGVYLGDGLVLTCSHLFRDSRTGKPDIGRVVVSFVGGEASEASLIAEDRTWDLALLRLVKVPSGVVSAAISRKQHAKGDSVTACGFGGSGKVLRAVGRITGFGLDKGNQTEDADTMIVSGSVRQGDSGGPMFNDQGEVCAVVWGSNQSCLVGTRAARCLRFVAKFLSPRTRPPAATPPRCTPSADCGGCLEQVEALRADLEALTLRVDGCEGVAGKDGRDGLDAAPVDVEDIIRRVTAGISIPTTFSITPIERK
jgi:hypothetical protein